jgi:hypothetical protein
MRRALFASLAVCALASAPLRAEDHALKRTDSYQGPKEFTDFRKLFPKLGSVNHHLLQKSPKVDDPVMGKSMGFPIALKIWVHENSDGFPGGIGKIVKERLFPKSKGYHGFMFNVAFACAEGRLEGGYVYSDYANPDSIWYNVFFGFYEIDVKKADWGRPFGYDPDGKTIHLADIVRIGKADWNHFSNQLFGVPLHHIEEQKLDDVDEAGIPKHSRVGQRQKVGQGTWDVVEMQNVAVVGSYYAKYEDLSHEAKDELVHAAWRRAFGVLHTDQHGALQKRTPALKGFAPTAMSGKFYMSYQYDPKHDLYRTYMFGGTVNDAFGARNAEFLEAQMAAVRKVIEQEATLGFDNPQAKGKPAPRRCCE